MMLLVASAARAPSSAAAQACDEDAGEELAGDEDAGDEDGGLVCEPTDSGMPPLGEPDASLSDAGDVGGPDAGDPISTACSCEARTNTGAGVIHVCTGGRSEDVCASFECDSSNVRARPCPTNDVALCCEMSARGLYSQLYEDCDHPNCETGFRAQCSDFGGLVHEGPCVIEEEGSDDDDSGGGCTVSARNATGGSAGAALWLIAISLWLRGRRRSRQSFEHGD